MGREWLETHGISKLAIRNRPLSLKIQPKVSHSEICLYLYNIYKINTDCEQRNSYGQSQLLLLQLFTLSVTDYVYTYTSSNHSLCLHVARETILHLANSNYFSATSAIFHSIHIWLLHGAVNLQNSTGQQQDIMFIEHQMPLLPSNNLCTDSEATSYTIEI